MNKVIVLNVTTIRNDAVCDALTIKNCQTAQLQSVLSLCKAGDKVTLEFVEIQLDAKGMPVED